jgi:hypothetical protein
MKNRMYSAVHSTPVIENYTQEVAPCNPQQPYLKAAQLSINWFKKLRQFNNITPRFHNPNSGGEHEPANAN